MSGKKETKETMISLKTKVNEIDNEINKLIKRKKELTVKLSGLGGYLNENCFALVEFKPSYPKDEYESGPDLTPVLLYHAPGTGIVVMNAYIDIEYKSLGFEQIKEEVNRQVNLSGIEVDEIRKVRAKEAFDLLSIKESFDVEKDEKEEEEKAVKDKKMKKKMK